MKRTLLAVACLCLSSVAFATTAVQDAKSDTIAQTVTSLCQDAGIAKSDLLKCEKRVQAIVVSGVVASHSAAACEKNPDRVKEMGLSEQCDHLISDATQVDQWRSEVLAAQK